jgi:hypothetical protein
MSEVARLRRQIEQECEALRLALHGYAVVSSHEIIQHKYNALGRHQEELEQLVDKEEAGRIVAETYMRVMG